MTNIIDILNNKSDLKDIIIEKNKSLSGRIPKEIKYENERKEVLNKLLKILGINENNKIFYIEDLESNDKSKQDIINIVDDVKKYFSYGMWVYFAKKNISMPSTSLSRSVIKDMKIKITTVTLRDNETNKIEKRGFKIHI